ncbi:MAG: methyltransferase domain-containing protein, partial [Chloroflexota bacterium]
MEPREIGACCAALYESDWVRLLLGDSFHPGGQVLTQTLGEWLGSKQGARVLDIASGPGTSAVMLSQRFRWKMTGVDLSAGACRRARAAGREGGTGRRTEFVQADSGRLPFVESSFDAAVCECSYCTFPDKALVAREIARVLAPGGMLGLADVTRQGELSEDLMSAMGWAACLAGARPLEEYAAWLEEAGFTVERTHQRPDALRELVRQVMLRLAAAEIMVKLGRNPLPPLDFGRAHRLAHEV